MTTYTRAHRERRGARAADPRRGVRPDRRRAGAKPRHDRRQHLRQRPDEPPAAADGRARRADDDRRARRRADGRGRRLLPRRVHDRGRPGRDADEDLDPAGPPRRLRLGHDRRATAPASCTPPSRSTAAPRIAIGCVDAVPHRATDVEARLERRSSASRPPGPRSPGSARTLDPPGDVHAPAAYRQHLAEVVAARAIVEAGRREARDDGDRDEQAASPSR